MIIVPMTAIIELIISYLSSFFLSIILLQMIADTRVSRRKLHICHNEGYSEPQPVRYKTNPMRPLINRMVKIKNRTKENVGVQQASDKILTETFENLHIEQDRWRIIDKTLQLLANGCPVSPEEIAVRLQVTSETVISTLRSFGAEFDKAGNILGVGLSLVPTPHVYKANGRKLYT